MKKNKSIDEQITSYEALMHRVLQNFNVKEDYEDLMQEMRIVVWKVLSNDNPKTMYIENSTTKLTTYLYRAMENKLINIFKVQYKIKPENSKKTEEEELKEKKNESKEEEEEEEGLPLITRIKRSIAKPRLIEDMSFKQQVSSLQNLHDADSIRLKTDIDTFCGTLDDLEKAIWKLNVEGWTQNEMAIELEKQNIYKNQSTISRKLKIINNKFLKFMEDGEI